MVVKRLVFLVIASLIEAATFSLWHTGLPAPDEAVVTLAGLCAGSGTVVFRQMSAGLCAAWRTGVVVAVWWAGQSWDGEIGESVLFLFQLVRYFAFANIRGFENGTQNVKILHTAG